ncbi:Phosphotransferase enzyme family protein [Micromonospora rhizosphaerae]|uniref:Phosphotransferase enzyme family protein n=1 Tax=Micromonospora rhizosphaerae TaxID=568872 RepID=A0A1C6RED2_9ACTN|nr:phosphotransferase [Micromonospora rhizosphaerae]SCL15443.1 Phosphotransferase enzyme family protein [Micromonospora rhizosphaerae]
MTASPRVADARAAYLPELAAVVWPDPADPTLRRGGAGYAVVPSAARPRLLVPAGSRRAAASAVRHSTEAVGTKARLRRSLLATAFRTGLGRLAFRDRLLVSATAGTLEEHLARVLGQRALLSIHIGPARANRKPVIQLLGEAGQPLGYAKLGVDPLTRGLVDAEAEVLRRLAGVELPGIVVAEVLHHGRWGGHALLVQSALPVELPRATPAVAAERERGAMVTVSRCLGVERRPYAGSGYAERVAAEVEALGDRPEAARLRAVLATVRALAPTLDFGAWHGDWNGGNSAVLTDGRVLIWDWERFAVGVPVGYDPLHRRLQTAITRAGVEPTTAARELLAEATETLAPFAPPSGVEDLVAVLYLVELAARYLRDRQAEAGARLGHVAAWLLPAVEDHLAVRSGVGGVAK